MERISTPNKISFFFPYKLIQGNKNKNKKILMLLCCKGSSARGTWIKLRLLYSSPSLRSSYLWSLKMSNLLSSWLWLSRFRSSTSKYSFYRYRTLHNTHLKNSPTSSNLLLNSHTTAKKNPCWSIPLFLALSAGSLSLQPHSHPSFSDSPLTHTDTDTDTRYHFHFLIQNQFIEDKVHINL